mmetsp:Transcript_24206/g.52899  ORF Transcript_24206/g.52899 Transcript_24206/m.52899 type:complete len:391 (+) Transcript_24206:390-1562(+)|eukprot:CAMPEP_0202890692 /NCGR_PEP_ID=MMETSP1392-20130828/1013_1 /ASSEMBLY_ACC=CAM_ASM_000868 /TAXON_ID=225041 /ORGANISM="Chlamydomonas chlamydogama, Strain SAG 11-48b" /LENGTH=390 /DNA_ID=CAMNT_0049574309 /DNA_START=314 /DNA_END=1486 /DNA_ORIENTATION=-
MDDTQNFEAAEATTVTSRGLSDDGVLGYVPRYAMPNIASMLPTYSNAEAEFIHRTFHTGNYDMLKNLPDSLKEQQVTAARNARMEAARRFLSPVLGAPKLQSNPPNQQGLFQTFEYIPSRYSLADELASKERVESEAKRMAIGGKEFTPTSGNTNPPKHKDLTDGKLFPYLGGAYEGTDDALLAQTWTERAAAILPKPFVHAGADKLGEKPTRLHAWDMMNNVRKWIVKDWEGAAVEIFENEEDCWVVRVALSSIDSEAGLMAYMNVFIRCNELINKYQLTKVVEFWGTTPDDGFVYFVMRPPWVRADRVQAFFALFPEERDWRTTQAAQDLQRTRPAREAEEEDAAYPASTAASALSYTSRLDWGVNFLTKTPSAANLSKMKEGTGHHM